MAEILLLAGIGVLFFCLVLTLLALLLLSGVLESIEIKTGKPPLGEAVIAYKYCRGPYKDCGPIFSEVTGLTPTGYKCIGIYYDDPNVVDSHKLRYIVGSVISEEGSAIDEEIKGKLLEKGYKIFKLPSVSYAVHTKFPNKSSLSILIAIARVYPKLTQYVKEHKLCAHPYLEIYEGNTIHFMGPLVKQNEFYVEESQEEENEGNEGDLDDDDSSVDGSLSAGNVSRDTSYSRSVMGEDISDSENEEQTCPANDSCSKEDLLKGEMTPRKLLEDEASETHDSSERASLTLQDSGFSSEQMVTPQLSPEQMEKTDKHSDDNESGSSFEEISMETMAENPPTEQTETDSKSQ